MLKRRVEEGGDKKKGSLSKSWLLSILPVTKTRKQYQSACLVVTDGLQAGKSVKNGVTDTANEKDHPPLYKLGL